MYECEKWHSMSGYILMCWDAAEDYVELLVRLKKVVFC